MQLGELPPKGKHDGDDHTALCFIRYIAETPPPSCRLSKNALIGLRHEMLSVRKSLKRGVAMHRTSVRAKEEVWVIAKATLLKCRT